MPGQLGDFQPKTGFHHSPELMARLKLDKGDWLFVSETADGGLRLTPYDPTFEKGLEIARKAMKTYRNALAELAK